MVLPVRLRHSYYDRCSNPIPVGRWIDLSADRNYVVLRRTLVGDVWEVSTVWLGYNYQWFEGPPLIFETMIFEAVESYDLGFTHRKAIFDVEADIGLTYNQSIFDFQARYSTEMQAQEGHRATVEAARMLFLPAVIRGGQNAV